MEKLTCGCEIEVFDDTIRIVYCDDHDEFVWMGNRGEVWITMTSEDELREELERDAT